MSNFFDDLFDQLEAEGGVSQAKSHPSPVAPPGQPGQSAPRQSTQPPLSRGRRPQPLSHPEGPRQPVRESGRAPVARERSARAPRPTRQQQPSRQRPSRQQPPRQRTPEFQAPSCVQSDLQQESTSAPATRATMPSQRDQVTEWLMGEIILGKPLSMRDF